MQRQAFERPARLLASIVGATILLCSANAADKAPTPAPTRASQRLREGTRLLDISGRFEAVGERVNFVFADSGEAVRVLENLALERVSRVLAESQGGPQWTISGTITEYNGGNYLLLSKAILGGKSTPPESAKASGIGTRPKVDYSVPKEKESAEKKSAEKNLEPSHDKRP